MSHIRVFGSLCYYHISKEHRHKLDSRAQAGILVGYASGGKGYRIMDLQTGKINAYHVVYFDEHSKADTKNSILSEDIEKIKDPVCFPSIPQQSPDLSSSVEDAEDQIPGGIRDDEEDSGGDMPA